MPIYNITERYGDGDCNSIVTPGFFNALVYANVKNGPGFYCYILVLKFLNNNLTQIAFGYNETKISIRYRYDGTWSQWSVK